MENETMSNFVYIGIPLDTVIVSGITTDATIQVTASKGIIVIEKCDDECSVCDDCRAELAESEEK